jgi:hypothetical protein
MNTQHEIAEAVITEMNKDIEDLTEVTPDFLLDMMGVLGVEFSVGEKASLAFITSQG